MRKEPRRRIHDIADVRIALEETIEEPSSDVPTAPHRRSVVPVLISMIVTALIVFGLARSETPVARDVTRTTIPLLAGDGFALQTRGPSLAISRDGRHVAYIVRDGSSTKLYLRALEAFDPKLIEGADGARIPFFSFDSRWLGFYADGELKKVSVTGGAPVSISEVDPLVGGVSWGARNHRS